tara:strand:- start:3397 stop:3744 length:348 start_codon:yes stop_codon:yes gene_type:complete
MSTRSDEDIIIEIKKLIESHVKPGVASHGGVIEFDSYKDGVLRVMLGGACSGCAGSTMTLKMGVENMVKHYIPEVHEVVAFDDPHSNVDPFYTDPHMFEDWDQKEKVEGHDESNN